ncbi:MAG: EF-hand domain-containing protein [Candidatus Sericytochromatia bacterium]
MNKKISLTTLGIMSTTLIGCSNQVDSIQPLQSQSQQVSAQSNSGLNNAESNFSTLFFEVIDSNKNGYITYTDLSSYLKNQSNELKLVFNKIDKDSDGKINLNDINKSPKLFLSLFNTDKQSLKRMATESFNKIDKDKDGKIIKSDFIDYIGTYFYFTLGLNNQLKKHL